jgi:hypothetical protein
MKTNVAAGTITLGYSETRTLEDGDARDALELSLLIEERARELLLRSQLDRVEIYACSRRGGYCVTQFDDEGRLTTTAYPARDSEVKS